MSRFKFILLGNLAYADFPTTPEICSPRLWAAYLLIDSSEEEYSVGPRQVRGFSWTGSLVFTAWIQPDDTIKLGEGLTSSVKMMMHDGALRDLGPTTLVTIGKFQVCVAKAKHDEDFVLAEMTVPVCQHMLFLSKIIHCYVPPFIGITQHVPVGTVRDTLRTEGL